MRIAIIGAGMAGVACADGLVGLGHRVSLFDKGRGAGGRMSTRRLATPLGEAGFDHGAQYFTARSPRFHALALDWQRRGIAARWPAAGPDAWVGTPAMNVVVRDMSLRHDIAYDQQIQGIVRHADGWQLVGAANPDDRFDAVVVAVPAEQSASILGLHDLDMARHALLARSQPCWTAMFAFDAPLGFARDVIRDSGIIGWAARNNAKPGRSAIEAWVVQASAPWSAGHIDSAKDDIEGALLEALLAEIGCKPLQPVASAVHRWRYALSAGTGAGALWNPDRGIGVCGDWLLGPRVECAWQSGTMLAQKVGRARSVRRVMLSAAND